MSLVTHLVLLIPQNSLSASQTAICGCYGGGGSGGGDWGDGGGAGAGVGCVKRQVESRGAVLGGRPIARNSEAVRCDGGRGLEGPAIPQLPGGLDGSGGPRIGSSAAEPKEAVGPKSIRDADVASEVLGRRRIVGRVDFEEHRQLFLEIRVGMAAILVVAKDVKDARLSGRDYPSRIFSPPRSVSLSTFVLFIPTVHKGAGTYCSGSGPQLQGCGETRRVALRAVANRTATPLPANLKSYTK